MEFKYDTRFEDDEGEIMTVLEFLENIDIGAFTDYDGYCYPMKDGLAARLPIVPSNWLDIPSDATHVIWFNK